jgi:hypothetical protein
MNARKSENYLAISRSSSASKSVEIFWAKIYRGQLFFKNRDFVEDHPRNIPAKLGSNWPRGFGEEA